MCELKFLSNEMPCMYRVIETFSGADGGSGFLDVHLNWRPAVVYAFQTDTEFSPHYMLKALSARLTYIHTQYLFKDHLTNRPPCPRALVSHSKPYTSSLNPHQPPPDAISPPPASHQLCS